MSKVAIFSVYDFYVYILILEANKEQKLCNQYSHWSNILIIFITGNAKKFPR